MSMKLRDVFTDDAFRRLQVGVECGPGRARQSMKAECDINNIMKQYARTGVLTHVARGTPQYLDVSRVGDFRELVERVAVAEKYFGRLPAKVRASFQNSPAAFLDACSDPSRRAEMVALGVLEGPVAPGVAPKEPEPGEGS